MNSSKKSLKSLNFLGSYWRVESDVSGLGKLDFPRHRKLQTLRVVLAPAGLFQWWGQLPRGAPNPRSLCSVDFQTKPLLGEHSKRYPDSVLRSEPKPGCGLDPQRHLMQTSLVGWSNVYNPRKICGILNLSLPLWNKMKRLWNTNFLWEQTSPFALFLWH